MNDTATYLNHLFLIYRAFEHATTLLTCPHVNVDHTFT